MSTINFQARLSTAAGAIVADGTYNVEFKLYNTLSSSGSSQGSCSGDAACLWTETRTSGNRVSVANGYLTVELGGVTAFPGSIDWSQDIYLSMRIGGTAVSPSWDPEMSPRLHLTAVPYAFAAGTLGGKTASNFVQLAPGSAQVDTSTTSSIFLNKTGASGNLVQLQQNATNIFTVGYTGTVSTKTTSNSSSAILVQNASNLSIMQLDTTNQRLGVGDLTSTNGPLQTLHVQGNASSGGTVAARITNLQAGNNTTPNYMGLEFNGWSNQARALIRVEDRSSATLASQFTILVNDSAGTMTERLLIDTTGNVRLGSTAGSTYKLNVAGDLNLTSGSAYRINGTVVCSGTTCTPASGSTSYIQNTTTVQTSANFAIRSAATGSVGAVIQGANGQTADLLRLQSWNGTTATTLVKFSANGALTLDGDGQITFTTPGGASINTKILIPLFNPGNSAQVLALGVPVGTNAAPTARVISVFDARTVRHQPSIATFSPDENHAAGFTWNGVNTSVTIQTTDTAPGSGITNSAGIILQSGHFSGGAGNTGDILITSGNASSSNSGNVTIDVGTAGGTKGTVTLGGPNTVDVNVGQAATNIYMGTGGANLRNITAQFANNAHSSLYFQNPSTDATHIQYAFSKRSNNLDLWMYGYNGTTFWNFLQTDWTNTALTLAGSGGQVNIGTSGNNANLTINGTGSATNKLQAANIDSITGSLSVGNGNATAVTIGNTSSDIVTTIEGYTIMRPANADSTTTFQITDVGAAVIFNADTVNNRVGINNTTPTESLTANGNINVRDGDVPSKQLTVATMGSSLELKAGGSGAAGNLIISGNTAADYSGTAVTWLTGDATNRLVRVGSGAGSSTPTLVVLDSKNDSASDPSNGVEGAMYYNASIKAFRCYENSAWRFCNDPRSMAWGYNIREDFVGIDSDPFTYGELGWNEEVNGTGSSSYRMGGLDKRPGIIQMDLGTSAATNYTTLSLGFNANSVSDTVSISGGEVIEFAAQIPTLSTATVEYDLRLGLCDVNNGDCTDGIWFEYDRNTTANWRVATASNGTTSKANGTGTEATVSTNWTRFKIVVNSNATNVDYYVNDQLIGSRTASIPVGSTRITNPMFQMRKNNISALRSMYVDYFNMYNSFTTPR